MSVVHAPYAADASLERLRAARIGWLAPLMWCVVASGALVFAEPSPYELTVMLGAGLLFVLGLRVERSQALLVLFTALISAGGFIGLAAIRFEHADAVQYVVVTAYLAVTMVVFAAYVAADPMRHAGVLLWGTVAAGMITSLAGLAGFLGGIDFFLRFDRAKGTFEDPNVMGAFLVLPLCVLAMRVAMRPLHRAFIPAVLLGLLGLGLMLTLSRAALGGMGLSVGLTLLFAFATSSSLMQRVHIARLCLAGAVLLVLAFLVLLSLPGTGDLVAERVRFDQSYDTEYLGRFDRWSDGVLLALSHPFGQGALQFRNDYPEEIHNVYLNTILSYGWLGGGAYIVMVAMTLRKSLRLLQRRDALREACIPVAAAFIATAIIGLVIDSDHWRHFFLLVGLVWGLDRAPPVARIGGGVPAPRR